MAIIANQWNGTEMKIMLLTYDGGEAPAYSLMGLPVGGQCCVM